MNADSRRKEILQLLERQSGPLSAGRLAGRLGVSRQIIVGDIALLRASGTDITATPRGYILTRKVKGSSIRSRVAMAQKICAGNCRSWSITAAWCGM